MFYEDIKKIICHVCKVWPTATFQDGSIIPHIFSRFPKKIIASLFLSKNLDFFSILWFHFHTSPGLHHFLVKKNASL